MLSVTEHVHEWELEQEWSGFMEEPPEFDGYRIVCNCGERRRISEPEIARRLNATERLSAELIREELGSYAKDWTGWDKLRTAAWAYASALEGEDA
jgi:hypothetical protein